MPRLGECIDCGRLYNLDVNDSCPDTDCDGEETVEEVLC
jgi:hypothetical protein